MFHGSLLKLCEMCKLIPVLGSCLINFKNGTIKDYYYKEKFCTTKLSLYQYIYDSGTRITSSEEGTWLLL